METAVDTTATPAAERPAVPVYVRINELIMQRANCQRSGNTEWYGRATDELERIAREYLPSGSGWDSGTTIDLDRSTADRIVLTGSFHHMDEWGGYAGWTDHTVTVRPTFMGQIELTISGRNRNGIKDYLHDMFYWALLESVRPAK